MNRTSQPKLSIITVIKNADAILKNLIDNVKQYKNNEIEFVVVDGGSTDTSLQIILKNLDVINTWISEPDKGIYDAMNKSIRISNGKWLYFMGADDMLMNGFQSAVDLLKNEQTLYYGGVIFNGATKSRAYNAYDLSKENVCHQAIFYPRTVFDKYSYEPKYLVFADYHLNMKIWNDTSFIKRHINHIVANYASGGFSHLTNDTAFLKDKENWFKLYLSTLDYLRYINRTKGIKAVLTSIIFGRHSENAAKVLSYDPFERKTILVIDDNLPTHDKSSGSKRLFELLKLFRELNLNVLFLPDDGKMPMPYYKDLQDLNVEILINAQLPNLFKALVRQKNVIQYAWISRPTLNQKYQSLLPKQTKKIFDTVDLHYLRMLRQSENENNLKLKRKALKTKKIELEFAKSSDATITVTDIEKDILEAEGIKNVFVIPNIHETKKLDKNPSFQERNGLLFIGGYKHEPNVDAVKWLIKDIMPHVWLKLGNIPVYLLGSDPSEEVLKLASDNVFVQGYIEDVSEYFISARVFAAPLRYGAGMKGKIGQSLEYGLPIVSTPIGTEGMGLTDGKNVLTAETTEDFANKIILLYQDKNLWDNIRTASLSSLENYIPENVKTQLFELFQKLDS